MTSEQRYFWRVSLELKMRKSHGDAFQDFFSTMMGKVHGDDFVRTRPFGQLGDKGCDGYLKSSGQVFACYGAVGGVASKVKHLIDKMEDDFAKALDKIPSIMKEWHFVHNIVEGLPVEAVEKLNEFEKADTSRKFGFMGMEGFAAKIFCLGEPDVEDILGAAATKVDTENVQAKEISELIEHVTAAANDVEFDIETIKPVPSDKLVFNELPGHWHALIQGGWQNADLVKSYLDSQHDPLLGERIARHFSARYQYLRAQNLSPGAIMTELYYTITGVGRISPQQQVAAQAIIAFLFESCDIFEDEPKVAT